MISLKIFGCSLFQHKHTHAYTHKHIHTLQTFRHGFPSQPTCLAYDPVQQLLAIGTENGTVLLYPTAAIGQMRRIIDDY